jgi:hypothetical protein
MTEPQTEEMLTSDALRSVGQSRPEIVDILLHLGDPRKLHLQGTLSVLKSTLSFLKSIGKSG